MTQDLRNNYLIATSAGPRWGTAIEALEGRKEILEAQIQEINLLLENKDISKINEYLNKEKQC